ncbi:hypothetical protein CYMTET_4774 [Cymbomonas tetramitiformis]|uniref:Uncharacterized protein n=1 Tax=Cymbomonas tetramitiformis TaxID=36881 RepID=A0AAE0H0I6_9CHLO|nr:hypothetical protein CYMTET_4774 [Cymbomonas tetramitiformis]
MQKLLPALKISVVGVGMQELLRALTVRVVGVGMGLLWSWSAGNAGAVAADGGAVPADGQGGRRGECERCRHGLWSAGNEARRVGSVWNVSRAADGWVVDVGMR